MIVPDANLLIYAYDSKSDLQPRARRWLEQILSGSDTVGLTWLSIGAFLRISTNLKLGRSQLPVVAATRLIDTWLARRVVRVLAPGDRHWTLFKEMLIVGQVQGPNTTDAQLAALTVEYGGVLHTADRDFARFPGLHWVNPLTES